MMRKTFFLAVFALLSLTIFAIVMLQEPSGALWEPFVSATTYARGDALALDVGAMYSTTRPNVPLAYYSLPVCRPDTAPLTAIVLEDRSNVSWCDVTPQGAALSAAHEAILYDYEVSLWLDGLIVVSSRKGHLVGGESLGRIGVRTISMYTHQTLTVDYHEVEGRFTIVRAEIAPSRATVVREGEPLHMTYEVRWRGSSVTWAQRWDVMYELYTEENAVATGGLLVSVVVVLLFSLIIMFFLRNHVHATGRVRYGDDVEELSVMGGDWAELSSDVWRCPPWGGFLAGLYGAGVQFFWTCVLVPSIGLLNVFMTNQRSNLVSALFLVWLATYPVGAWFAGEHVAQFGGGRYTAFATFLSVPFVFILSLFFAFPAAALFSSWVLAAVALSLSGYVYGLRHPSPCKLNVSDVRRDIPAPRVAFMRACAGMFIGFINSLGVVLLWYFLFGTLWSGRLIHAFPFIVVMILVWFYGTGIIGILSTYALLREENWHWHWHSYVEVGLWQGFFFLVFCFFYWLGQETWGERSSVLFWIFAVVFAFFTVLGHGSVSYWASRNFVYWIYTIKKRD